MPNSVEHARESAESPARKKAKDALLDAALKLLIDVGYAKVTTRELAAASGVNQGLIHYYFGSLEEVLFQALERYSDALIARQRAMYAGPEPFITKWRTAMGFLEQDLAAGYPKVAFEMSALGWNHPRFRARAAKVLDQFRDVVREALRNALPEYGLDEKMFPLEGVVSLVMTSQLGYMFEWLGGVHEGHRELLAMFDGWLEELSRGQKHTQTRTQKQTQKRTQTRTQKTTLQKKRKKGADT
jgi:AcrR family transcriptional regulator